MKTVRLRPRSWSGALLPALAAVVLVSACSGTPSTPRVHATPRAQAREIAPTTDTRHAVVARAMQQIGAPYRAHADGPDSFDDSGLAYFAYHGAGAVLPRAGRAQLETGKPIDMAQAQPGDLIFFRITTAGGGDRLLVGLYTAPGTIVMASPGGHAKPGVRLVQTDGDNYWQQRQVGVIRVLP